MDGAAWPAPTERPNEGWDPRLRVFRAGDEVDTFALVTQRYVVLVDTMATPQLAAGILDAVRPDLAGRRLLVVNTHADYDHCWGNAVFAAPDGAHPAPIIAHELARARLRSEEARDELAERQRRSARFAGVGLVEPTIAFAAGLRLYGGDLTLELLPAPGHTEDHVAVWVSELRLLLAGDAAEAPFPYVSRPETLPMLRATLRRLRALDPALVLPCHGGTTDPALLDRNGAFFDALERRVRDARDDGRVPADWREREELPDLLGLPLAEVLRLAGAPPSVGAPSPLLRDAHLRAVRATLAHLDARPGDVSAPAGRGQE